jgi:hypothetical protein
MPIVFAASVAEIAVAVETPVNKTIWSALLAAATPSE